MEHKSVVMLNKLDLASEDIILKVRVIRYWKLPDLKMANQDYSIEMLLIDEEGTRIPGSVMRKWFFRFEKFIEDNSCLVIKKPSIGIYNSKNKYVDNQNKLFFNYNTHISKCLDFNGPEYGFQFQNFQSILNKEYSEKFTIDIIGHVVKVFPNEKQAGNDEKKRLTMQLEDLEGNHVFMTLWDTYVIQMENYITENSSQEHVVIIQFAKVKWYNENPYVQNCFGSHISRLFVNGNIDEINKYKKSLSKRAVDTPSSNNRPLRLSMFCSLHDEFCNNVGFISIGDICEIIEEKHVIILGTIKAICREAGWKYNACKKCFKKVVHKWVPRQNPVDGEHESTEEQIDYCTKCDSRVVSSIPKLKIQIRVQDLTGVVSVTLWDRELNKLLKTTARDLISYMPEFENDVLYFPELFYELMEKQYAFKIEIGQYNLTNNYPIYGVVKLTDDSEVIAALETKFAVFQSVDSESQNITNSDFNSEQSVKIKVSTSMISENSTPLSTIERKLTDVYESEECSTVNDVISADVDSENNKQVLDSVKI